MALDGGFSARHFFVASPFKTERGGQGGYIILIALSFTDFINLTKRLIPGVVLFWTAITVSGQSATPTPTLDASPPVQRQFQFPVRPLPSAERVGVELSDQLSLTLDQ